MERPAELFYHFSIPAFDEHSGPRLELGANIGSSKFTVPAGAVLVSKLNPRIPRIWEPNLADSECSIASTEFMVLKPRGIDRRYLRYLFLSPLVRTDMELMVTGTSGSHQRVRPSDALSITVPLPPLPEQRAIAHVLGTLDDKIDLNRRMNETLEEMARALFKSWFVDFDPVRAKMEGRWRRGESLPGLPTDLYDLFPDRMVDSELGEIPEGWEVKALGKLVELNPQSWSKKNYPLDVMYVDLANTKWGVIESTQHFLWKDAPSRARRILRPGDTIVGTVRPGNGSYSLIESYGLTGSTGFAVLRPSNIRFRELVYLSATALENIERLAHGADGAAYPAVRPEIVLETKVAIPTVDNDILDWFPIAAGSILDKMESNKTESSSLAEQRDALLPKLVSGKVRTVSTP